MPTINRAVLDTLSFAHTDRFPSWDEFHAISRECTDAVKAEVGDEL